MNDALPKAAAPSSGVRLELLFGILSPLALLLGWEILARTGVLDARIFSRPSAVVLLGARMFAHEGFARDVAITVGRIALGLVAGAIPGLLLGLIMGLFRWPRAILNPLVQIIYPLPRIALFPLVLIIVGVNETSNTVMVALGPFFIMLESALHGVLHVEPIYLRVGRSFRVNTVDMYRWVVFPAALPAIVSGLRLSLGMTLFGVVAVEYLSASDGIGHMIWNSWQVLSLGRSMVGLVVTGVIGYLMVLAIGVVERWAIPWAGQRPS